MWRPSFTYWYTCGAFHWLVTEKTKEIIAIKTALWQFSKKSYCVLVHGPHLKSKKLTKCDSWKLKFHTKPHNNHTQNEKLHAEDLFPSRSSFLCMHVANCWCSTSLVLKAGSSIVLLPGWKQHFKCCDYCEVLCEILIFSYHISLISYFLDGVHGLEHNNFF